MKLLSYRHNGRDTFGAVTGKGVCDLAPRAGTRTLREALAKHPVAQLAQLAQGAAADARLDDIIYLPVIPDPAKILCVGLNYEAHRIETGRDKLKYPVLFTRFADTQVGHRQPLVKPSESDKFDFEGELAVVIGRRGRRIPEDRALDHVAGYTCYHDGSVRDWQGHSPQFTPGKNFPATGGMGPWMVTPDEAPPVPAMVLTTRLNGVEVQKSGVSDLIFSVPALIAYISRFTELAPGDVIATGTPGGVGYVRKPPLYMKGGDEVEAEITGIGTLSHPVIAEGAS
ncbi:MAG: fumarylacetoacetate hydrolase family protein [Alphaproteobacteria bacterium]|nr:fumarylacetoacetate hydrolase family protein [Alphaproteobacteria bacterium]